jgi:nucleoside-triphosphatase
MCSTRIDQPTQPTVNGRTGTPTTPPLVLVLTGEFGSGKSSICRTVARTAEARGMDVAGVVCPAIYRDGRKVGIRAIDLRAGTERLLATLRTDPHPGELDWAFDGDVLAWTDRVIAATGQCDLLIVDELGPLELERGEGMVSALELLRRQEYKIAVVVVRPRLLERFQALLGLPCNVHQVTSSEAGTVVSYLT